MIARTRRVAKPHTLREKKREGGCRLVLLSFFLSDFTTRSELFRTRRVCVIATVVLRDFAKFNLFVSDKDLVYWV